MAPLPAAPLSTPGRAPPLPSPLPLYAPHPSPSPVPRPAPPLLAVLPLSLGSAASALSLSLPLLSLSLLSRWWRSRPNLAGARGASPAASPQGRPASLLGDGGCIQIRLWREGPHRHHARKGGQPHSSATGAASRSSGGREGPLRRRTRRGGQARFSTTGAVSRSGWGGRSLSGVE